MCWMYWSAGYELSWKIGTNKSTQEVIETVFMQQTNKRFLDKLSFSESAYYAAGLGVTFTGESCLYCSA